MSLTTTGSSYLDLGSPATVRSFCAWYMFTTINSTERAYLRWSDETTAFGGVFECYSDSDVASTPILLTDESPPGLGPHNNALGTGYLNTWFFVGGVWEINGLGVGTLRGYTRLETHASLTAFSQVMSGSLPDNLNVFADRGGSIVASGGRVTAIKAWTGQLTSTEMLAESKTKELVVTSGAFSQLKCNVGDTIGTDQSGAGHNWTVTGSGLSLVSAEPYFLPRQKLLLGVGP